MERGFELDSVVEDCLLAIFVTPMKSVGEYGGGVNDDDGDKGEHLTNIHHNFDYPILACIKI